MNNSELNSILKRGKLPETPEASLALLPRRVVAQIRRGEPRSHNLRRFASRLTWAFGLALVCIILLAIMGRPTKSGSKVPIENDGLANAKLIREAQALFPNRVRAIIQDDHGLNVVLSDSEDIPDSAPLYVRICDGKRCSSAVTFSGQEIQLSGRKVSVLADADGGIILEGNKFVWTSTGRDYALKGLKIEARPVSIATM